MCGEDLQCRRRAGVHRVRRAWVCGEGSVGLPKLTELGEIVLQVSYLFRRWETTPLHGGIKRCRCS